MNLDRDCSYIKFMLCGKSWISSSWFAKNKLKLFNIMFNGFVTTYIYNVAIFDIKSINMSAQIVKLQKN